VRRFVLLATLAAFGVATAACGSDDDDRAAPASDTTVDPSAAGAERTEDSEPSIGDTEPSTSDSEAATPLVPVAGADICATLTPDVVGVALGLTITGATPDDSSTPQCAYEYASGSGGTSNLTVASMRPDDVGGLAGAAAFEYVADINRSIAAGTEVDEVEPGIGEQSLRLSGEALHLGVLAEGGSLFTVIVPVDDADGAQVDALLGAMAESLA
jgi:hypothetical protein